MSWLLWLILQNLDSGLDLWNPGALPPALLAFSGFVHPIHPSWHMAGLGYRFPQVGLEALKAATVLHFSGPAKPWLEIGDSKVRSLWTRHLNYSNEILRECRIREWRKKLMLHLVGEKNELFTLSEYLFMTFINSSAQFQQLQTRT